MKLGRSARPLGSGRTCTARLRKVPASAASFFMLKSMIFIFGGGGGALTQPGHPQRRPPLRPVPVGIRRGAVPGPDAATDWPRPRRQALGPDRLPKWRRRSPRAAEGGARPGRCARRFPPWGRRCVPEGELRAGTVLRVLRELLPPARSVSWALGFVNQIVLAFMKKVRRVERDDGKWSRTCEQPIRMRC